ncbi:hypothetical protein Tel_00995 [Candidatus Tenderia electrophaga]|jgi:hypothetical protein|uniref:Uncharacterized protein n=1 Tax=Candidatus Tenderia electrophaga TaxID=1748243 RepID=A0A0S2T9I5_9GAMM|nr:hypothetical protein Tel_00995 [Candidatus Tenderia electrophaga]
MSSKQASKRGSRKYILRAFQQRFDLDRLDYKRRIKPGRDVAKITGLILAAAVYLTGFGLALYSYNQGMIDANFLNKISWIFMIPASVVGMFAYLITSNRREFPIREDIRAHVRDFEGEGGYLWRYAPILEQLELKKIDMEWLVTASREGRLAEMAPEDICTSVHALYAALQDKHPAAGAAAIDQIEQNLDQAPATD